MGEFEEKKINTEQTDVPKKRDYEKELIAIIKSGEPLKSSVRNWKTIMKMILLLSGKS